MKASSSPALPPVPFTIDIIRTMRSAVTIAFNETPYAGSHVVLSVSNAIWTCCADSFHDWWHPRDPG